jgi:AraC-like DNA-binding protein
VLAGRGTVDVLLDVRELMLELAAPHDECLVIDPAIISVEHAEAIVVSLIKFPRALVAFASVSLAALESSVILAQRTAASFVFRGTPNERSALERALLLAPDSALGLALLALIETRLMRLPSGLRERLSLMLRNGDGPNSPDALAAASALGRRSLDRYLEEAGFGSARRVIEAARVTAAYRALTTSRTPLVHVASVLGYKSQRTLDSQLSLLLGTTCAKLRSDPISCAEAAERLAQRLTTREPSKRFAPTNTISGPANGSTLTLISGTPHNRRPRKSASGDR